MLEVCKVVLEAQLSKAQSLHRRGLFAVGKPRLTQQQYGKVPLPPPQTSVQDVTLRVGWIRPSGCFGAIPPRAVEAEVSCLVKLPLRWFEIIPKSGCEGFFSKNHLQVFLLYIHLHHLHLHHLHHLHHVHISSDIFIYIFI